MNQDIAQEILEYLQAAGIGTIGSDMFIGTLPEETTTGLFVMQSPSPMPHLYLDTFQIVLDFWYRHPKSNLGYEKLMQIYNILHRKENWTTDNYYIYFSFALGQIKDNDRDREGGKLYSLSVQFIARNANIVS